MEDCGHPARALLDFHLNGSLTGEDEDMVLAHLESCSACAAEVDGMAVIAAAIERHGTGRGRGSARHLGWWPGIAAAAALAIFGAFLFLQVRGPRGGGAEPVTGMSVVDLDLGAGVLRDAQEAPVVTIGPEVASVRASFFPPVGSDPWTRVGIVDAAGRPVVQETTLPSPDPVGRTVIMIPAASLTREGRYRVVVRAAGGETLEAEGTKYPFDVRRPHSGR